MNDGRSRRRACGYIGPLGLSGSEGVPVARTIRRHRRRLDAALLATAAAVAAIMMTPQPAGAYTPTLADCVPPPPGEDDVPGAIRWKAPPQYVIHLTEFWDGGGDADDLEKVAQALYDINVQLNQVGESTAEVLFTGLTVSNEEFEAGEMFADTTPTLHIGFSPDSADTLESTAATYYGPVDLDTCTYDQAHIVFRDLNHQNWNFDTPQDSGQDYYTAGLTDTAGAVWFRPIYMHELLHAFGLAHSDHTYSMMNYHDRPWANRPGAESIRPLPDDVRGLRELYPGTGRHSEVALLNTWFDPATVSQTGAANQFLNCAPSLGDTNSADIFAPQCGDGGPDAGSTDVCPGDFLRTRFTVANYSTHTVNLTARMWLSRDEEYDWRDVLSVTPRPITVTAAESDNLARSWIVPNPTTLDADYHIIVRITGTTTTGDPVDDWIPLTGTVHVLPAHLC
jgi:hypothetical protein